MVDTQAFMNVVLALSAVVLVGISVWVGSELVKTLRSVRRVADDIQDTTHNLQAVKQTLKVGALSVLSAVLGRFGGSKK